MLTDAGRLTTIAILKNGVLQEVHNQIASLVFGLSPVRQTMVNKLAELSVGYPRSPLTRPGRHRHDGPAAGQRAPVKDAAHPVGAGSTPQFAIFAEPDPEAARLLARHADLLEPSVRTRSPRTASGSFDPTATLPRLPARELGPKSTTICASILAGESGKRAERH